MNERKCQFCGKLLSSLSPSIKLYCSVLCRKNARANRNGNEHHSPKQLEKDKITRDKFRQELIALINGKEEISENT